MASIACLAKLNSTPFARFLNTPSLNLSLSRLKGVLDKISIKPIGLTVGVENVFLPLIKEQISLIVRMRADGLNLNHRSRLESTTFNRLFDGKEKNAKRMALFENLIKLGQGEDEETTLDFVRVFIMFVCNCILFSKTTLYTRLFLFSYVDNLKMIRQYAWGTVVHVSLVEAIFKYKAGTGRIIIKHQ